MAGNIRLKDDQVENGNEIPAFVDSSGCQLCLKKASKYTCPRCNVKYCSLECYRGRKHMECSESFYKKCVMDVLQGDTIDKQGKRKMAEILNRFEKEESGDGPLEDVLDVENNLEERLHGLNLDHDTEKIWEKLTLVEKKEFQRAVDDGYIGTLVETWTPWWITKDKGSDETSTNGTSGIYSVPKLLKDIPPLSSLIKSKQPSPENKYNLVNILYSYIYICRLYNGCHYEFLDEAVDRMWRLSTVLYHSVHFASLDAALRSAIEASQQDKELFSSEEFSLSIIDDIVLILKEDEKDSAMSFIELALSDIHRLFARAIKQIKINDETKSSNTIKFKEHTKSLWLAKKKVLFMLAWFHENIVECLTILPFFFVLKEAKTLEVKQIQEEKLKIQESRVNKSGKKLIEELN